MSRTPADVPASASYPTDERRSPRHLPGSPHRHTTLPSDRATQPLQGASSSASTPPPPPLASSSASVETPAAAAPTSDLESDRHKSGRTVERSSPSASSSQGDMADTEMEAGPSKATASESAPEGPPPKKKRTRTLTTPHQAAVLHALLAQSRFPTTQMREEVGRSIGLSARKVQIWFQNQRQKARRPRGQTTTSAPLTRPPQFGPFTNAPPGTASSEVSPTATTAHSGSSAEGFFARGPAGFEMSYGGASAPSGAAAERFAHAHRDPYLADDYPRSSMPTQLAGPGIPGASRRPQYAMGGQGGEGSWRALAQHRMQGFVSRPSTSGTETAEMYRTTPRPGRPAGEQGPGLPLSLPSVITNIPRGPGPASSPIGGSYPSLASLSSLEAGPSSGPRFSSALEDRARALPQPNIDFSAPRQPLNIPPPFTLQPQPQWDDPAFSPYNTRRRSPPALPHGVAPPFSEPSPTARSPFRGEPLPSISTVLPRGPRSPSSLRSPRSPTPRSRRFDPIRSSAGRAPPEHPARPGFHDYPDEPPAPSNR